MIVYVTPDGRWRIQVTAQRIEVYERVGTSLTSSPRAVLRSPPDLEAWLAEQGWTMADLIEG